MTQNLTNLGPKIALFEPDIPQNTAAIIRLGACLNFKIHLIEPCGFSLNDKRFKRVVMDYEALCKIILHSDFETFLKIQSFDLSKLPELSSNERVGILFGDYNASPNANWEIHDDGQTRIHWNNGEIDTLGFKDLRDDKWHHLVFVRDLSESKFYGYVDGEPDIAYNTSGSNITLSALPRIGGDRRNSNGGPNFHGKIDEVKIWNVALDSSQVLMRSSIVRLDTSIPTLASVTLNTSNNSQNLAKPGDNLKLDFTVSEDIPQPTVNLAGHAVIPSNSSGDGKTWQAVYRVDNTTLNENVSFNIGFSDAAGNVGDNVTTVTSGTTILVDTEPPSVSYTHLTLPTKREV